MKWKKEPGTPGVQAPISHGGSAHDYVISHRKDQHTVSYRPPGKHEHVGTFTTERQAKAAAASHAKVSRSHATKKTRATKKTPAQLDREIAHSLAGRSSSHSTKSDAYDKDDARRFGQYAYRMEQTKAQALASAKAEGFAAHHLGAVEDGWEGERRDTVHGGFAGTSHATRRKVRGRSSHATKGVGETMFAVEIDRSEFEGERALPTGARWRADLVKHAEDELGRGRTYRRPKDARYAVIEWTGYRGEVGRLLDWMEGAPGITRYAEIFE